MEDQARGFRYCSDVCARAYRQQLSDQVPWDHELRRKGYWQIIISASPVKTCPTCDKKFKSVSPDAVYCSPKCLGSRRRKLADKPCKWCNEMFRPKDGTKVYCSMRCRDANRVDKWKRDAVLITCPSCSSLFRPNSPNTIFCKPACFKVAKNARRRQAYVFKCEGVHVTQEMTPQKFDWLLLESGLRITSEVRLVA